MGISQENKDKIINLFQEAIDSYNKVMDLRKSEQKSLVNEFNSNLQYYASVECAFRCIIEEELGKKCPQYLHEMVEVLINELSPNPLEVGIDLFYILRYKDTRNATVHKLDICELNAYPKLFLNGYKFIQQYIDDSIEVKQWKEECDEFDYASFNQIFKQSIFDNIRVLVLPPVYGIKEKLEILSNYHWNIVLDFDPYSEMFGAFQKSNLRNKRLIQLSQIEKYSSSDFSVEDTTWVMCDGDKMMNIKSFKPKDDQDGITGLFIPAMLEGAKNWTNCFNTSESRFNAKKLLNLFFEKYFQKIQYNVNLVFVMDYAPKIFSTINDSILSNLDTFMYEMDVHILNEALSEQLDREKEDFEKWNVYNASFESFLRKIEQNAIKKEEGESAYLLPCVFPSDGKLSERAYSHIKQDFFVLHSKFPVYGDDINVDIQETVYDNARKFLRGEQASWQLIKSNLIPILDIGRSIQNKIEKYIETGRRFFNIYHAAGFGGSTIARQIAYNLSTKYPVLFMKHYAKDELGNRITQIYNITHKKVLIWVEEEVFDNIVTQRNECLKIADATSAQVMFIFVARRPQAFHMSSKDGIFICKYSTEDVEKIIELNKNLMEMNEEQRMLVNTSATMFIRELGEDNICPFLINLSIYRDEFIKIDDYISPYISEIVERQDLFKVFVYICIFTSFINRGVPLRFLCQKLSITEEKEWPLLRDKYDPLIYVRHNIEYHILEVVVRAPYMAECLLRRILGNKEEGLLYREQLNSYLKQLIEDIKISYHNSMYAEKSLRQLFIDKGVSINTEDEYSDTIADKDLSMIRKYFAPVIAKLWDKDNIDLAGEIFETLIKNYPKDSYFYAHAARYYAYTGRDYTKAKDYYDQAIKYLQEKENSNASQADIYHVKGMCIREELFKSIENLPEDKELMKENNMEDMKDMYYDASLAFDTTLKIAVETDTKTIEYAYTAWLTLIFKAVLSNKVTILKDSEIADEIQKGLTIISNLEDLYLLNNDSDEEEISKKMEDIARKKETLYSGQKEFKEAIEQWNNYYVVQKNSGNYLNCFYACKQRFYLIESRTKGFIEIADKDMKRISQLAEDCYQSILYLEYSDLRLGDLKIFLTIAMISNFKIDSIMSKISGLYQQERKNLIILYYRYVLKFLKAYKGDKLALQEYITYESECKKFAERHPGKANIIDYFVEGSQMEQLLSRKRLLLKDVKYRSQAYKAEELKYIYGILKQQGTETTIIPFDSDGKLMTGIEVHANLKYNPDVEAKDSGQKVRFRFGFSYDGLKAENMSIRYAEDDSQESSEGKGLEVGDYVDFTYKKTIYSKKTEEMCGIVGYVGMNENCILHISQIANRRITEADFARIVDLCKQKTISVQLYGHSEKGWEASLKSQKLDFNNLSL